MIAGSTDSTINPQKGGIEVFAPTHIQDHDPIGDQAAAMVRRTTQQHIQPEAIKSRFITNLPFTNNPDIGTADPLFNEPVLVASGSAYRNQWWTRSVTVNSQQVFGIPLISVYVTPTAITYDSLQQPFGPDPDEQGDKWPNVAYHMGTFPVTIWHDQFYSGQFQLYTHYAVYNNSGADAYIVTSMRMRMLMNSGVSSVTS